MAITQLLLDARRAYSAQAWSDAYDSFARADSRGQLPPGDLMTFAFSAFLVGREELSIDLLGRAFRGFRETNDGAASARAAFWLAFVHGTRGDAARAEAWGRRLAGIVDDESLDAERALVCSGIGHMALASSDPADIRRGLDLSREALAIARPSKDTDTSVLARLNAGWALLRLGNAPEGIAELDEAMAAVTSGEVRSPLVNGVAYCSVISASLRIEDVGRAREWTSAASEWCERHPDLVPFRGQCLVHRSVVKMLDGDWPGALAEAVRATDRLLPADVGAAWYQIGELHRLVGRFAEAEDAYRLANSAGRRPEPGLVLLRLAQGRTEAAAVSARRLNDELTRQSEREEFLPAFVEVMAVCGDVTAASTGAAELGKMAEASGTAFAAARSLAARGIAQCAAGEASAAVASLREASLAWHELRMPYFEAKARAVLARCYAALGDGEASDLEVEAARSSFERLGAASDLAGLPGHAPSSSPLTAREADVIRLVATGLTNRAVADALVVSEKTVARHLANIYVKLGIASRTAATAYAYDHGLVSRP